MNNKNDKLNIVFFGTPQLAVTVLDELYNNNIVPCLVVTTEDKPTGRKLVITPPPVKVWADQHGIAVMQPKTLKNTEIAEQIRSFLINGADLFVVVAYGKIIPQNILDIPTHGSLNLHFSLLPKLRGASPMMTSILTEDKTGVTIMLLDALMDHGPVVKQEVVEVPEWPAYSDDLEKILSKKGGELLADTIPKWIMGQIQPVDQDHSQATVCKKITKEDGLINLDDNAELNLKKIRAFNIWPKAYTFFKHKDKEIRIAITRAHIENEELIIEKIIPEGRKEMSWQDFLNGLH